jgi:hypothetical protein
MITALNRGARQNKKRTNDDFHLDVGRLSISLPDSGNQIPVPSIPARLFQIFPASLPPRHPDFMTAKHRIFTTSVADVYPFYIAKAEKKGRNQSEVDAIICWLTGYTQRELEGQLKKRKDFETFFKEAPKLNPSRSSITGTICGVRIEDIQEPTMREIRYLDKLVDELAKGRPMEKILRTPPNPSAKPSKKAGD